MWIIDNIERLLLLIFGSGSILYFTANKRKAKAEASRSESENIKAEVEIDHSRFESLSEEIDYLTQRLEKKRIEVSQLRDDYIVLKDALMRVKIELIEERHRREMAEKYKCTNLECNDRA